MEKFEHSNIAGGNIKWGTRFGKHYQMSVPQKVKKLPSDSAAPHIGELKTHVHRKTYP